MWRHCRGKQAAGRRASCTAGARATTCTACRAAKWQPCWQRQLTETPQPSRVGALNPTSHARPALRMKQGTHFRAGASVVVQSLTGSAHVQAACALPAGHTCFIRQPQRRRLDALRRLLLLLAFLLALVLLLLRAGSLG